MREIQKKENMISYCHLKKIKKKNRDVPKLGQNWAESCQNWQKLVKNWYYVHFETKKYIKKYKIGVFQNKEDMISYYQLKKISKKVRMDKNQVKMVKNEENW